MNSTLTTPVSSACLCKPLTSIALSTTGLVLAIVTTRVKPPAAAACVPEWKSSFASWPGSRKCVWISIRPGATIRPVASYTSAPSALKF